MNDHDLIERCLDGSASPQDMALVRADPTLRKRLLEHHRLEVALRSALMKDEDFRQLVSSVMQDLKGRDARATIAGLRQEISKETSTPRSWRGRLFWLLPLATAALVLMMLAPWRVAPPVAGPQVSTSAPPVQEQEQAKSRGWLVPQGIPALPIVLAGETLAPRAGETLRARLADHSEITLTGPADLIVGRTLRLRAGRLHVVAAKHAPTDPLIVQTPHGRTVVVGTEFNVEAGDSETAVGVDRGAVQFIPNEGAPREVAAGDTARSTLALRDPIHQPFASDSPWNTALGSGATFEPVEVLKLDKGAMVETQDWSIPIFVAAPADPVRELVFRSNRELAGKVRVSPDARASGRPMSFIALVDEQLGTAWELYAETTDTSGNWLASDITRTDLRGNGWNCGGPNHAGASMLGGLIRKGELRMGVAHALAVRVRADAINASIRPYEWPASRALSSWHRYGSAGNIRLGALLALPPAIDLPALGLKGDGLRIAKALQDYGAYVVGSFDAGEKDMVFVAEQACSDDITSDLLRQLDQVMPLLQKVSNNGAETPGGGGTPRIPPAPPLIELPPGDTIP